MRHGDQPLAVFTEHRLLNGIVVRQARPDLGPGVCVPDLGNLAGRDQACAVGIRRGEMDVALMEQDVSWPNAQPHRAGDAHAVLLEALRIGRVASAGLGVAALAR